MLLGARSFNCKMQSSLRVDACMFHPLPHENIHSASFVITSLPRCLFSLQWPDRMLVDIRILVLLRLIHSEDLLSLYVSRKGLACLMSWSFSQYLDFLCSTSILSFSPLSHKCFYQC